MEAEDFVALGVLVALLFGAYLWRVRRTGKAARPDVRRQIAVDGTNVLFWRDEVAQLATLQMLVLHLQRKDYDPVVFLDASTRHHLKDKSLNERRFASLLGLPTNRVMVCPARTEADAFILDYAGKHGLAVISNDRFRDRPREARNIRLVKGRFDGQRPILTGI